MSDPTTTTVTTTAPFTTGSSASSASTAFIGESITIKGTLSGEEDLIVNGNIELRGSDLVIGKTGRIRANLLADDVLVDGEVIGDVVGVTKVVVSSEGRVRGNIVAPRVTLEDGAQFKGRIDMDPIDADAANAVEPPLLKVDAQAQAQPPAAKSA